MHVHGNLKETVILHLLSKYLKISALQLSLQNLGLTYLL